MSIDTKIKIISILMIILAVSFFVVLGWSIMNPFVAKIEMVILAGIIVAMVVLGVSLYMVGHEGEGL